MKACIVGGGIGGLTCALAFARAGIDVEIFEQANGFREIGAGIQLSPNATRVLHGLGAADALRAIAFVPERTEMRQWQSGEVVSVTTLGESLVTRFGAPYYHVHRADLIDVLANAVHAQPRVRVHLDAPVIEVGQNEAHAWVRTARDAHTADVVVGADGIRSRVRAALFGEEKPRFTGNVAWRATVPTTSLPPAFVAPAATVWMGPGKHLVHYYVRGGALVNVVAVVEKDGWEVESWTERGRHEELCADFAGWHDGVARLLATVDPQACFKWALFDREPMSQWSRGRITLLGDACHPTLPFMAQGAAMAIEDAAVAASCLAQTEDVVAALARYESLRKERTAGIQSGSRRNAGLFHLRGEDAEARDRGLRARPGPVPEALYAYDAFRAHEAPDIAASA